MKVKAKLIRNRFITGIAVIIPLILTILILKFAIVKINNWILTPFAKLLRPILNDPYDIIVAKIAIFFLVLGGIYLIGWAANVIVIRKFFSAWEGFFANIPLLGRIYKAIKQISAAFLGQGKTIFRKVVLVEYPRKGVWSVGFLTYEEDNKLKAAVGLDTVNVFLPTTPNPTTGVFIVAPRSEVKFMNNISIEEGMKIVISGGAVNIPADRNK